MIDFKGDLSQQDAEVLKYYAERNKRILEFGCGGSTQILAAYTEGNVTSLDTEQVWIDRTKNNLKRLGIQTTVIFKDYYSFDYQGEYDVIFVDGVWEQRRAFAEKAWSLLKIGGVMIFHDTRRQKDIDNVLNILSKYALEVSRVDINKNHSNMTVVEKKEYEPYIDWNKNKS